MALRRDRLVMHMNLDEVLFILRMHHLVEESNDLARDVLSPGLLVVHDAGRSGEDDVSELTGWEELDDPLLHFGKADVIPGGDTTGLVDTSVELDNNLAGAVVIDLLELANVAVLLHNAQELDNDLRGRPDENLSLTGLLGIVDGVQAVIENGSLDHFY